jgi:5-oxoprolinase (ATP-hydrolysing)
MTVSILSNGRQQPAFGLLGGEAGAPGANRIIRRDGQTETLPACAETQLQAGDTIEIQTPGGGGFGAA